MAHAELTQAAEGEAMPPRPRSFAAALEASLGMLVEIPAALLVVAEIVILFAGVVARYGLHRPLMRPSQKSRNRSRGATPNPARIRLRRSRRCRP